MPEVENESRDEEELGVRAIDLAREALVAKESSEKEQGEPIDAERMLESRVCRRGVDERDETELTHSCEPPKRRRVDESTHAWSERHVELGSDADRRAARVEST
jgi:hypothetical protein